jgi:membrane protease YdiL (CAAX protease family)
LAFVTLVVVAPIAEEIIFRGYMYGKLKKFVPIWVAILATSLLFGAVHGAWNLAIDTFALSIVLCSLREFTGNIWASILLHMVKNGIAFYILFIYPTLLTTLGG